MIETTFDTTVALSGLYLWMLFGYLASMMNCDIQRLMKNNVIFRHIIAISAFFFLFTVIDNDNNADIGSIWLKTLFVYVLYIMAIKSKWYFSLPVICILLIDQTIKMHVKYLDKNKKEDNKDLDKYFDYYKTLRDNLNNIIITIIVIGFIHYSIRKYNKFGSKFSFYTLLMGTTCSK